MTGINEKPLSVHGWHPDQTERAGETLCGRDANFSIMTDDLRKVTCGNCQRVDGKVVRTPRNFGPQRCTGLDQYQDLTSSTAIYPGSEMPAAARDARAARALPYLLVKLASEAGEVGDAWAKHQRDGDGEMNDELRKAMVKELGDVMWYVAQIALVLGHSLSWVAQRNLAKLASRKERGVLGGSGDNR